MHETCPTVRLLHTSDLHIGADHLPRSGLDGLRTVLRLARANEVDAVLVAGDLFDHARIPDSLITDALAELARFPCQVVVAPGNHDLTAPGSVYERADPRRAGEHVRLARDPDGEHVPVANARAWVWCRGFLVHEPAHRPLAPYTRRPGASWQLAMAHGHYQPQGAALGRSSPIGADEIAAMDCDYLALGHWHHFEDVSCGDVAAYYSGTPADRGRDYASVNLVTLAAGVGATVERLAC
jgi:DNA repair exonuclease SbcCD nuclease subunit